MEFCFLRATISFRRNHAPGRGLKDCNYSIPAHDGYASDTVVTQLLQKQQKNKVGIKQVISIDAEFVKIIAELIPQISDHEMGYMNWLHPYMNIFL